MHAFEYQSPATLEEAVDLLREHGEEGKLLAGGTALVILMKQRLLRPACLVSLRRVPGLNRIEEHSGEISLGALVTHREAETSPLLRKHLPALAETYHHVATIRVRNMATVGGSLAHADPNQDPPVTLMALQARVVARGPRGERQIPLDEFFVDYYATALRPDELVTGVVIPRPAAGTGTAFLKFLPRTADDYATVAVAAAVTLDADGTTCRDVRIALGCLGATPLRARRAEEVLRGQRLTDALLTEAGRTVPVETDPVGDHRGSVAYKREMAAVFTSRAVREAAERARQSLGGRAR